jgi:hypothetical protein
LIDNLIDNVDVIESLHSNGISLSFNRLEIKLVKNCEKCLCNNFYIWGTVIKNELRIELRCVKCGKIISRIKSCIDEATKDALEKE